MAAATMFARWFNARGRELRVLPAEEAADRIADALAKVDDRLGVEVGDDPEIDGRELIVTAFSDPSLFGLVRQVVKLAGDVAGWRVVALKPARGFDFELALGEARLRGDDLRFRAASRDRIDLVVPEAVLAALPRDQVEELAWLLLESGVGEEDASLFGAATLVAGVADARPISEIEAVLETFRPAR